jgi:large subunit ribosomal protein L23
MSAPFEVLVSPLITEKGTLVNETSNQVVFRVRRGANKEEIRRAVETFFKVKVEKVHTVNLLGKRRRSAKGSGKRSDWKKAYVTLAEGQTIDFFEGA